MNSLKTEWLKIKNYPGFWWVLGICMVSYPSINYIFHSFYLNEIKRSKSIVAQIASGILKEPFAFPEVFRTVAFTSSLFVFIPAILVIMLISNEFSYKTHRQNIIDGWSRNQFMKAKFINVLIITIIITLLTLVVCFLIGFINKTNTAIFEFKQLKFIGFFFLQVFSQLSFAFLLGLLFRKAFLALGVFIFYSIVFETAAVGLLRYYFKDKHYQDFLPLQASDNLTPVPTVFSQAFNDGVDKGLQFINQQLGLTILYTAIFWMICFWVYKKRDL